MAKMSIVPKLIDELLKKEFNSLQLVLELSDRSGNEKKKKKKKQFPLVLNRFYI